MSKLGNITDTALERVLELAGQAGDGLKHGGNSAADWLKTGAAIGALKTGGKVATRVVRRNPGAAVALAAVGLGVLGYAAYRKRQQAKQPAQLDGTARRVDASKSTTVDEHSDIGSDT
jgi:uncharacterized membrane protein YebE (DUF533 family)